MIILGIESSCDETAISLVKNGHQVLSNTISSQINKHKKFGGVVPELAAREHLKNIDFVLKKSLEEAHLKLEGINAIAVTAQPGLIPALLVGVSFANGLKKSLNVPLIAINHLQAHIYSVFLEKSPKEIQKTFPSIALLISGGHTQLFFIDKKGKFLLIGTTIDDACGEAFDKAARLLGLSYPGGPIIDKLARLGNKNAIIFPRPLTGEKGKFVSKENKYNFSFSGLKTALFYHLKDNPPTCDEEKHNLIASYQEAIIDVLTKKTFIACKEFNPKSLLIAGGVACNSSLRENFLTKSKEEKVNLLIAEPQFCTDNAAMIAGLAYYQYQTFKKDNFPVNAQACSDTFPKIKFSLQNSQ